jgi:hypothetical protein
VTCDTKNLFKKNPNPLISCRVSVGFTGRVKIAGPSCINDNSEGTKKERCKSKIEAQL